MKKKGFTLIETMAVLIILAILAMILIPMVNDIITSSRKKAFKETVNNLLESSSIYEAGYLMNNGQELSYPVIITCNGEACADELGNAIDFKGPVPISGRIILESSELMRADLISNGMFCGSGTKGDIEVHEYCSMLDHTNPIVDDSNVDSVSVSSTTNSVIVSIPEGLMYDEESGIDRYEITIYEGSKKIETKTYEEPNVIFYNLKNNTEYKIEITGINGNRLKTTIERSVRTLDITKTRITYTNEPNSSVNGYFKSQTLNVSFVNEGIENPEYYIRSGRTATANTSVIARCGNGDEPTNCEEISATNINENIWYKVEGNISVTYNVTAASASELTALVYDGVNYGGADTKTVGKIDQDKPTVSVNASGKIASITKGDNGGSGLESYCITINEDGSNCLWTPDTDDTVTYTAETAGTYYVFVKDGVGNVSSGASFSVSSTAFCQFTSQDFGYTGGVQTWTVPEACTGIYKLEVWGAKGGTGQGGNAAAGSGGYATGNKELIGGTQLNIVVGGSGYKAGRNSTASGGYNGGGSMSSGDDGYYHGSGGGATHIALKYGSYTTLASYGNLNTLKTYVYIIAGGGGGGMGGTNGVRGGSGGGTNGGNNNVNSGVVGTQSSGNALGQGASGGGGGLYGGSNLAGGSGYVGGVLSGSMSNGQRNDSGLARITFIGSTYIVTYNANGGTVSPGSKSIDASSGVMGTLPVPTNGNKKFWGWYTDTSWSTLVTAETVVKDNTTIYARWADDSVDFNYTGKPVGITIPTTGTYKLEVWGAQGGNANYNYIGGKGGYTYGEVNLTSGQNIYVVVGAQGSNGRVDLDASHNNEAFRGAYNGGGFGNNDNGDYCNGAGGGATHIATTNRGLLYDYNLYRSEVLIVAGGGGGAHWEASRANAGGSGNDSSANGVFGGKAITDYSNYGSNGGGWSSGGNYGKGGSGYTGSLTNAGMQSGVRTGNGTAKITFISE